MAITIYIYVCQIQVRINVVAITQLRESFRGTADHRVEGRVENSYRFCRSVMDEPKFSYLSGRIGPDRSSFKRIAGTRYDGGEVAGVA